MVIIENYEMQKIKNHWAQSEREERKTKTQKR